jgi:cyclic pyranopterin phosphate synthase
VSVDSLDDATAGRMNGLGFKVGRVLRGIDAAAALGLPIKINTVIKRGVNDHEILHFAITSALVATRCGSSSSWMSATRTTGRPARWFPPEKIVDRIQERWPLEPLEPASAEKLPPAIATPMAAEKSVSSVQ